MSVENNSPEQLHSWSEVLNYKARLLHQQVASIQNWVDQAEGGEELQEMLSAPYYELLQDLYEEDFPVIRAIETSDLLLRFKGPAVDSGYPKVSLLAVVFSDVRGQVGRIAKSIAGLRGTPRLPKELDVNLAALARGSLYMGFTLPLPEDEAEFGTAPLFDDEQLYEAAREAVRVLGVVTKSVSQGSSFEEIKDIVSDPVVRDTTLSAIENLSPSGRKGIDSVQVGVRGEPDMEAKVLTPATRAKVREWLEAPIRGQSFGEFEGIVREIDLDSRRFELRKIEGGTVDQIRCTYSANQEDAAREWLDKPMRISGTVELDLEGQPRMLEVENTEFL